MKVYRGFRPKALSSHQTPITSAKQTPTYKDSLARMVSLTLKHMPESPPKVIKLRELNEMRAKRKASVGKKGKETAKASKKIKHIESVWGNIKENAQSRTVNTSYSNDSYIPESLSSLTKIATDMLKAIKHDTGRRPNKKNLSNPVTKINTPSEDVMRLMTRGKSFSNNSFFKT